MDIAAAAVKQGAGESSEADEAEIPASAPARERHPAREREAMRKERRESTTGAAAPARRPAKGGKGTVVGYAMAKLYVGGGRKLKIRPGDIVGAITNEMSLDASTIGAIQIWDRHSIVEVPETIADEVIRTLSATTIKGKKLQIRRDRSVR